MGYLLDDGTIKSWNVDPYRPTSQQDVHAQSNEQSPIALLFEVDPDGGIVTESPSSKVEQIVQADPRLYDAGQRPVFEDSFDLAHFEPKEDEEGKTDFNFVMSAWDLAPPHRNRWTGKLCNCPWHSLHRRMQHTAGEHMNKLLKAPDKAYRTPEGQEFLERLQAYPEEYESLYPYIAHRWKKGDIRGVQSPVVLQWNSNAHHHPDVGMPPYWQNLDYPRLQDWHEWYEARQHPTRRGVNIMDPDFTMGHLNDKAIQHQRALEEEKQKQESLRHGETVYQFPNGWSIRHLTSQNDDFGDPNSPLAAMEAEGCAMGHCLASSSQPYMRNAEEGLIEVYSLRDPKGQPHATWHYNSDGSLAEKFGANDSTLKPEYQEMLDEWGEKTGNDVGYGNGHQEDAEDEYITLPAADDLSSYLALHGDDGEYAEYIPDGANYGENTEINWQEPEWGNIASGYFNPQQWDRRHVYRPGQGSVPEDIADTRRAVFDTALNTHHLPRLQEAIDDYPITKPHEEATKQEWDQWMQPYYHPITGEFVPHLYNEKPIWEQYQSPLFTDPSHPRWDPATNNFEDVPGQTWQQYTSSWDPTICEQCGAPMTEPKQLGHRWVNQCTRGCIGAREVPAQTPLLKQQLQNNPPYPELLDSVGTPRAWIASYDNEQSLIDTATSLVDMGEGVAEAATWLEQSLVQGGREPQEAELIADEVFMRRGSVHTSAEAPWGQDWDEWESQRPAYDASGHQLGYDPQSHQEGKGFILEDGNVWTWPTHQYRPVHAAYDLKVKNNGQRVVPGTPFHINDGGVFSWEGRRLAPEQQQQILQADPRLTLGGAPSNMDQFGHGQSILDILDAQDPGRRSAWHWEEIDRSWEPHELQVPSPIGSSMHERNSQYCQQSALVAEHGEAHAKACSSSHWGSLEVYESDASYSPSTYLSVLRDSRQELLQGANGERPRSPQGSRSPDPLEHLEVLERQDSSSHYSANPATELQEWLADHAEMEPLSIHHDSPEDMVMAPPQSPGTDLSYFPPGHVPKEYKQSAEGYHLHPWWGIPCVCPWGQKHHKTSAASSQAVRQLVNQNQKVFRDERGQQFLEALDALIEEHPDAEGMVPWFAARYKKGDICLSPGSNQDGFIQSPQIHHFNFDLAADLAALQQEAMNYKDNSAYDDTHASGLAKQLAHEKWDQLPWHKRYDSLGRQNIDQSGELRISPRQLSELAMQDYHPSLRRIRRYAKPVAPSMPNWEHWFNARQHPTRRGVNIMEHTPAEVSAKAEEHARAMQEAQRKKRWLEMYGNPEYLDIQHQFGDEAGKYKGWNVVKLDRQQAEADSEALGHCIGSDEQPYAHNIEIGNINAYSLRDAQGYPHVSWHVNPSGDGIGHMQGKSGDAPEEYRDLISRFNQHHNLPDEEVGEEALEPQYDAMYTFPSAYDQDDYVSYHHPEYYYDTASNDANIGEDTEFDWETPAWDKIAQDYLNYGPQANFHETLNDRGDESQMSQALEEELDPTNEEHRSAIEAWNSEVGNQNNWIDVPSDANEVDKYNARVNEGAEPDPSDWDELAQDYLRHPDYYSTNGEYDDFHQNLDERTHHGYPMTQALLRNVDWEHEGHKNAIGHWNESGQDPIEPEDTTNPPYGSPAPGQPAQPEPAPQTQQPQEPERRPIPPEHANQNLTCSDCGTALGNAGYAQDPATNSFYCLNCANNRQQERVTHVFKQTMAADPYWLDHWMERNGPYLWHQVKSHADIPKILKEGLVPLSQRDPKLYDTNATEEGDWYRPRKNHVYLLHHPEIDDYNEHGNYLRVDLRKLNAANFNPDEDAFAIAPELSERMGVTPLVWNEQQDPNRALGPWAQRNLNSPAETAWSLENPVPYEFNPNLPEGSGTIAHRGPIPPEAIDYPKFGAKTASSAINQADATNDPLGKNPAIIPSRQGDPEFIQTVLCPSCLQSHKPDEPCPDSAVTQYKQQERQWYRRDPNAIHSQPDGLETHQTDLGKSTKWHFGEYQGWASWDTWNTALVMDNEQPTYQAVRQLIAQGGGPEQIRDWALQAIIGPYNKERIADAQEWNEVPEDERVDHHFEDLKNKSPQAADIVDQLGFGADVSDTEPQLIDPALVDWNEIYQKIRSEEEGYEQPQTQEPPMQQWEQDPSQDQPGDMTLPEHWSFCN